MHIHVRIDFNKQIEFVEVDIVFIIYYYYHHHHQQEQQRG